MFNKMLSPLRAFNARGVLGINKRNGRYILAYNTRAKLPIVDDKLLTKQLAQKAGIAIPQLYGVIQTHHDIKEMTTILDSHQDFAIKPAHGMGGEGILIITGKIQSFYRQVHGQLLKIEDLHYHIANTLAGMHSLGGIADKVIIEYRVKADPTFIDLCHQGIPDIRVITLFGYPIMAMARLPTNVSNGKANLHQGAIGVGIDLATGITEGGVWHNDNIDYHPDTLKPIANVTIPHWDEILRISAQCYELTSLGFLGVDIVLDKTLGPLMLEINARPGLNIQIANRIGLLSRCQQIEARAMTKESIAERIRFVKNNL